MNELMCTGVKLEEMTRPSGERKYQALMKLARTALTLNHGNADVERGFSKNKLLLTSHRTRHGHACHQ